jgi:DNA-binding HxlR family transcriptional regulator
MPHAEEGQRTSPAWPPACCPHLHEAVELVGRRWTGAILEVLRQAERPLRFSEIAAAIPQLSDRLLSERVKELERRGLVERDVHPGPPLRVSYELTEMGRALEPALTELKAWAQHWLPAANAAPRRASRHAGPPGGSI